jgi:hypothetical protein
MTGAETPKVAETLIKTLKDLPFWMLAGLAIALDIILYVSSFAAQIPSDLQSWFALGAVFLNVLAGARLIDLFWSLGKAMVKSKAQRKTFHLSADEMQAHWGTARQPDGSVITQLALRFVAKNLTDRPLGLAGVKLLKPRFKGEVTHADVSLRGVRGNMYGSLQYSDHRLPPQGLLPGSLHVMVRGIPKTDTASPLRATFRITDDEGNHQKITAELRGMPAPVQTQPSAEMERISAIGDPIEKEVASVLKAEVDRYNKNGRVSGGFGSLYVEYQGRHINGFGQRAYTPNVPNNQSIVKNSDEAKLCSDNLEALLAYYVRLSSSADRERFVQAILIRLSAEKEYFRISYFLVCVLLKVGKLRDALQKARDLPQGEIQVFGLSNVLYMLGGLLRYTHAEFTTEMLDEIDSFVHDVSNENAFAVLENIAAIRAMRLRSEGPS